LVYQTYLLQAQARVIQRVREDLARLGTLEMGAREKSTALARVEATSRAERDALRAQTAVRRRVLAGAAEQIRKSRKDLASAQQDEVWLARLVEDLAHATRPASRAGAARPPPDAPSATQAFGALRGQLRIPVQGKLAARFGSAREQASASPKGVFISAAQGAEVRAVAPGQVVFADWMRGYGNLLIVDHGDGYLSIYGNNESVLTRVGDAVHAGETVATVGASGGNETSGLYFELRHRGKPFDPVPWLQAR